MAKKIFTDVVINEENKKDGGEILFPDLDGGRTFEAPFESEEDFDVFFMNPKSTLKL